MVGEEVNEQGASQADSTVGEEVNEQGASQADSMVTAIVEDGGPEEEDEGVFKIPTVKRKSSRTAGHIAKTKKADKQTSAERAERQDLTSSIADSSEDEYFSDSSTASGLEQPTGGYTIEQIMNFLKTTKNQKNIQINEHFPDLRLFVRSVKAHMSITGQAAFPSPEVYRVLKFLQKAKEQIKLNDDTQA